MIVKVTSVFSFIIISIVTFSLAGLGYNFTDETVDNSSIPAIVMTTSKESTDSQLPFDAVNVTVYVPEVE